MVKKILDEFIRLFVGVLFIFSGLIKLNDPVGTEIKMEEYFHVFADDFGSFFQLFIPWSLEIGFILIVLEIVLGVALLIRFKMPVTSSLLLILILFFTALTFYSAFFNKVTDCGCFGDAIKLTPWQSFTKDVILTVLILHLYYYRKTYTNILYTRESLVVLFIVTFGSIYAGIYAINHLPFIDFRAYRIGSSIPQQMTPPEPAVFEYIFRDLQTGEDVSSKQYLLDTLRYQYVSMVQTNKEATKAKITDYSVFTPEGENVTQATFSGPKLLFVAYDINKASLKNMDAIRKLTSELDGKVEMMLLTASPSATTDAFRHANQLGIPYFQADATVLKTIIRSNPGITLWKDGVVLGMWHHNDTPQSEEILYLLRE